MSAYLKSNVFSLALKVGGFSGGPSGKEPACQYRRHKRQGFNPWVWKSPWRRARNPLQSSCLENPMDRGAWWATVHGAAESDMTEHIYLDALASDFHSLFYVCIFNLI